MCLFIICMSSSVTCLCSIFKVDYFLRLNFEISLYISYTCFFSRIYDLEILDSVDCLHCLSRVFCRGKIFCFEKAKSVFLLWIIFFFYCQVSGYCIALDLEDFFYISKFYSLMFYIEVHGPSSGHPFLTSTYRTRGIGLLCLAYFTT